LKKKIKEKYDNNLMPAYLCLPVCEPVYLSICLSFSLIFEAYDITLPSVSHPLIFWLFMRPPISYQRKAGDQNFLFLQVSPSEHYTSFLTFVPKSRQTSPRIHRACLQSTKRFFTCACMNAISQARGMTSSNMARGRKEI
jgi:hypothetical protein